MSLSWEDQYCKNEYTTKCNLQIQCAPYQIISDIFHRTRTTTKKKKTTIHNDTQRPQIAKAILRKKNGAGGNLPS